MRAIDTNVLVRLITRDEPDQVAAAERFIEKGAWISHLALAEATWVLDTVYNRTREDIAIALEMLLKHQNMTVQDADVVFEALLKFRRNPRVEFSDCLLLEIARKAGHLPFGTFDRQLGKVDDA